MLGVRYSIGGGVSATIIEAGNVFTVQNEREELRTVQFGMAYDDMSYYIDIYKNPDNKANPPVEYEENELLWQEKVSTESESLAIGKTFTTRIKAIKELSMVPPSEISCLYDL